MAYRAIQDTVPFSESLSALSHLAERLYWRMLSQSDSWGRLPGSLPKLRARCVPMVKVTDAELLGALQELEDAGRLTRYGDNGSLACQLLEFDENQPPSLRSKRGSSKFPEPPTTTPNRPRTPTNAHDQGRVGAHRVEVKKTKEVRGESASSTVEELVKNTQSSATDIQCVYDHWRKARGKTDSRYDRISNQRRTKIKARLREFSVDELCRALDAVAKDDWEGRDQHDDLVQLFRSREKVDSWLERAEATSGGDARQHYLRDLERRQRA